MSQLKIVNNKGPKTEPFGTPNNISLHELYLSFILTETVFHGVKYYLRVHKVQFLGFYKFPQGSTRFNNLGVFTS